MLKGILIFQNKGSDFMKTMLYLWHINYRNNEIIIKKRYMKQRNFMYEPPIIEVIEVEVEGGFAVSGYGSDSDDSEFYF